MSSDGRPQRPPHIRVTSPQGSRPATPTEVEARTAQVAEWLCQGKRKGEIKRLAKDRWGIRFRQCQRYITEAHKHMMEAISRSADELVAESYAFYVSMTADHQLPPDVRLRARAQIDELMGLNKPQKIATTTADGKDVQPINLLEIIQQVERRETVRVIGTEDVQRQVQEMLQLAASQRAGIPPPPPAIELSRPDLPKMPEDVSPSNT